MFTFPVSRVQIVFGALNGWDEIELVESAGAEFGLRVNLVKILAPSDDIALAWDALPAADVDAALLAVRRHIFGDRIIAELKCPACGEMGDLTLSVDEYLEAHAPELPSDVTEADGQPCLNGTRFRLPTVADFLDVIERSGDEEEAQRLLDVACIASDDVQAVSDVNRVLEKMAPALSGDVQGACHACGAAVGAFFDPGAFTIAELRQPSMAVFEHVHLLASRYRWSEEAILSLPSGRRGRYAEMIADAMRASASYSFEG